ncbi:hypothetical protein [Dokdonella immobilis]|nr:hypothetical protein [Dokdonella immobilis]
MAKNYERENVTIQQAMMAECKRLGKPLREISIRWQDHEVKTFDWISVSKKGKLTVRLLHYGIEVRQAVDIRAKEGGIFISDSDRVEVLRTWADPDYEDVMIYPFECSGELCISTACETLLPNGKIEIERFTGNSGFWVEEQGKIRTYHASPANVARPNFESFVFSIEIEGD